MIIPNMAKSAEGNPLKVGSFLNFLQLTIAVLSFMFSFCNQKKQKTKKKQKTQVAEG